MVNRKVKHAVRTALIAASTGAVAYVPAASAQDQELEQIVVTGSRIPQPNIEGTSPVSVIGAQEVKLQGVTQVEDLVNNLPQAFADQGGNVSNAATGTATVNLRNLGPDRTLVLVNGKRLPAGSPNAVAADLNQIPAPLIERVEVLTGGASAVYGSDAVAGVVNFIMNDNFEGVQLDLNYSFYQHDNSNSVADVVRNAGYAPAPNQVVDGNTYELSMLLGSNFADGRGNATLFVGYRNIDALLQTERDYSACSFGSDAAGFTCGGSYTSYPGAFITANDFATVADSAGNIRDFEVPGDLYNYGPLNYYQRPDERYAVSAFAHYDLSDSARVYTELSFHDDRTVAQIAPSGLFGLDIDVSCANPLLSSAWRDSLGCESTDVDELRNVFILRRNVEGGGRQDDLRHTSYRGVVGVKGTVFDNWNYDVFGQYGTVIYSDTYYNDFSKIRSRRAVDVVPDWRDDSPTFGQPVCRSVADGSDPNCVPYDIWRLGGVSQEALAYLQTPGFQRGDTTQTVVGATMSSDLGAYGIKSPAATQGIGFAFGAEYRQEGLSLTTDQAFETGDLFGQGGPVIGLTGDFNVMDFFGEARIPLVEDVAFAQSLSLNASYRYSDYSDPIDESTNTYGVGLDWAPVDSFKVRGSYQRAVRAPNVVELFQAAGLGLYDSDRDPCAGDPTDPDEDKRPTATLEQCQRTGVTPEQYGNILDNSAQQYNAIFGGNLDLIPETSDSFTVGFVFTPTFFDGFNVTIDYFNIKVEDAIANLPPPDILNYCLETGDDTACGWIQRDARGTLWATDDAFIEAINLNIGKYETSGVDVNVNYGTPLGDYGSLSINMVGTYLDEFLANIGFGEYDCAGLYGGSCGTPLPEWRHKIRATWTTPWNLDLSLSWRYIDSVLHSRTSDNELLAGEVNAVDRELDAQNYIDLAASWTIYENYTIRAGINNLGDTDPPLSSLVGTGFGNGNTFPQVYDALGREVFVSLTAKF